MNADKPSEEDHRARSNFARWLMQRSVRPRDVFDKYFAPPPRRIVQFWDDVGQLPCDVRECIDSWKTIEKQGFVLLVFDEHSSKEFIATTKWPLSYRGDSKNWRLSNKRVYRCRQSKEEW